MPLQQIQLDQSIYNKQQPKWGAGRQPGRSPVSEALTPQPTGGGGFAAAGGTMPNKFVEEQKAIWAEEDKLKKLERDAQTNKAQEIGMRALAGVGMRAQGTIAQAQQQTQAPALTKEDMPKAAMEAWKFISTLDEAGQKFYIQKLKQKELARGGFIEAGGVRKEMPGSLGMYGYLVDQGLIDPATDTVIKKERLFEKTTFKEDSEGNIINTATGETIIRKGDIPKEITTEQLMGVIKQATTQTTGLVKPGYFEGLDAKGREEYLVSADKSFREYVAYILSFVHGVPTKEATRMANNLPKQDLTPPPGETVPPPEGGEIDEGVVTALKLLLEANPDEINNIEQYKDEYGEANVNEAWGISTPTPTPTETTPLKTSPSGFKGSSPSGFKKEKYGKYKAL